jgi:hypothetical protein
MFNHHVKELESIQCQKLKLRMSCDSTQVFESS